jgi:hypothetical protein
MSASERHVTFNMIACAGDDVTGEFEITFRYGHPSVLLGALVNGTEVGPAIARILAEAVSGAPPKSGR